jgi:hypothetical protein
VGGRARIGLLLAALLALLGVVAPIGSPDAVPPPGRVVAGSVSTGQAWQDSLHTFRDEPRRLVADRHAPPTASDTAWVLDEQATGGCPAHRRARAGDADDSRLACATPPPRSSRAPPADVS